MKTSVILWNVALYVWCIIFAIAFAYHQVFYTFPTGNILINVFPLALYIMIGYKIANYAADRGEFIKEE